MKFLLLVSVGAALLGCGGCRQSTGTANAASNEFPAGSSVYLKRDHSYAGTIIQYDPNHTFPDGQTGAAALVHSVNGQSGWYHAEALPNSFTSH